jgi:hypothetical protein
VDADEIASGLWRWTARHAAWEPDAVPESPADWPPDVGCLAWVTEGGLVFVDPLVPVGTEERFWHWADGLARGRRVVVLTTIEFHRRSREQLAERYKGMIWSEGDPPPSGLEMIPIEGGGENMVWIESHRALIPGDRLLGDGVGGLRMCPESWLGYLDSGIRLDDLRERLRRLLDLPIQSVLVSHGEPVLRGGREALRRALSA